MRLITILIVMLAGTTWAAETAFEQTLISVQQNVNVGDWEINHSDLDLDTPHKWYVEKYTLHGGMQEGVEIIEVFNGKMTMKVIPTRGMNILNIQHGDIFLGWNSPVKQVVHPKFSNLEDNDGKGWLYTFNEWMMRAGIEFAGHPGSDDGRLLSLHGRIANTPASEVKVVISKEKPHRIHIIGEVEEVHFKFANFLLESDVSLELGSDSFRIDDHITNRATDEKEFMIIYHVNYGKPILEAGAQLHGTIEKIMPFDDAAAQAIDTWNVYGPPAEELAGEVVYCIYPRADESGLAHFMMQNAAGDTGIYFRYPVSQLPYFSQWKNPDSVANGYVTGLEPATGFVHNRAWERKQGRVPTLKGGQQRRFQLDYTILTNTAAVADKKQTIDTLNQGKSLEIIRAPEADPRDPDDR